MKTDFTLELQGQACPLPVIKTQNTLDQLALGQTLKIICTDPNSKRDIPAWCKARGQTLLLVEELKNEIHFVVKKNSS